jgi:hypothetical protein
MRNSSLEKRLVGSRRDMLISGKLVRGVSREGKMACMVAGQCWGKLLRMDV